jgi:hypothetical protein
VFEVRRSEAEPAQVVGVVAQRQVPAQVLASEVAGAVAVGVEDDGLFRDEEFARSEDLPGGGGVFGWNQLGMGAVGAGRGQVQHARAECRDKADRGAGPDGAVAVAEPVHGGPDAQTCQVHRSALAATTVI